MTVPLFLSGMWIFLVFLLKLCVLVYRNECFFLQARSASTSSFRSVSQVMTINDASTRLSFHCLRCIFICNYLPMKKCLCLLGWLRSAMIFVLYCVHVLCFALFVCLWTIYLPHKYTKLQLKYRFKMKKI